MNNVDKSVTNSEAKVTIKISDQNNPGGDGVIT